MESLAISTTNQQGNGGSESGGSEAASPMSPDGKDDLAAAAAGGGGAAGGVNGDVGCSHNGEEKTLEEVLPPNLVPESGVAAPPEQVSVKDVTVDGSGAEIVVPAEVVPCEDMPIAKCVDQPVPIIEEEKMVPGSRDVIVEKIDDDSSFPRAGEDDDAKEGVMEGTSTTMEPAKPPPDLTEKKPEVSCLLEPPSDDEKDRKIGSTSAESDPQHRRENADSRAEVVCPPQVAQRASWLSCCGLLDVFRSSNS